MRLQSDPRSARPPSAGRGPGSWLVPPYANRRNPAFDLGDARGLAGSPRRAPSPHLCAAWARRRTRSTGSSSSRRWTRSRVAWACSMPPVRSARGSRAAWRLRSKTAHREPPGRATWLSRSGPADSQRRRSWRPPPPVPRLPPQSWPLKEQTRRPSKLVNLAGKRRQPPTRLYSPTPGSRRSLEGSRRKRCWVDRPRRWSSGCRPSSSIGRSRPSPIWRPRAGASMPSALPSSSLRTPSTRAWSIRGRTSARASRTPALRPQSRAASCASAVLAFMRWRALPEGRDLDGFVCRRASRRRRISSGASERLRGH